MSNKRKICWLIAHVKLYNLCFLKNIYFIDFLQRGRERDRELET